jgi:signal transduction histidine kinase
MNPAKSSAEREQTNDSLREERRKSDRAIAEGRDLVAEVADEVLRHARTEADAVLLEARDKADRLLSDSDGSPAALRAVQEERAVEDATVRDDRAAADEMLDFERLETMRLLSRLLPNDREQTDGHLQAERVRSDGALANRDDFLGVVVHDLRDLLGGVAMSATVIAKAVPATDECGPVAPEIARILRHVTRASRLISDLVDVASIDAGRLAISITPDCCRSSVTWLAMRSSSVRARRGSRCAASASAMTWNVQSPTRGPEYRRVRSKPYSSALPR